MNTDWIILKILFYGKPDLSLMLLMVTFSVKSKFLVNILPTKEDNSNNIFHIYYEITI